MFVLPKKSRTLMVHSLKDVLRQIGHSISFAEIPPEVRQKIHRLCADFVGGAWARTRPEDLSIKHLRGGTSNVLFLCALPPPDPAAPSELLLRIYFNPNTENHVLEESVVFTLLAERKLGPKLYGIFGEGRLEEYIHSRALLTPEIRLPIVSAKVARILGQIHQLIMPIDKRPVYLISSIRKWMEQIRSIYESKNLTSIVVTRVENKEKRLTLDELAAEIELVGRCLENSPSPIVFCHNDFQEGNILLRKTDTDFETADFGIIDYEYSSYNYRGFDIANHFCEWTFDYHSNNEHPYFSLEQEYYPEERQQRIFAESYLREIARARHCGEAFLEGSPVSFVLSDDVRDLLNEVKSFVPVSHFFWGVWALLLAETSPVQFGYTEYAHCRLGLYYRLQGDLLRLLPGHTVTNGDEPA